MLAASPLGWDVSEAPDVSPSKRTVCARCNEIIEVGALRLRPAGTTKTRYVHVECCKGLLQSAACIANSHVLDGATAQRLERALLVAEVSSIAPGDVPHPNIADARHEEVVPTTPITYTLKNLTDLDQIPWEEINCNSALLRVIAKHWLQSMAKAKHAVVIGLLTSIEVSEVGDRGRHWKLLACVDAMLFSRPPRFRGGKKGQVACAASGLVIGCSFGSKSRATQQRRTGTLHLTALPPRLP